MCPKILSLNIPCPKNLVKLKIVTQKCCLETFKNIQVPGYHGFESVDPIVFSFSSRFCKSVSSINVTETFSKTPSTTLAVTMPKYVFLHTELSN